MTKQTAVLEKQVRELTRRLEEAERRLQDKEDELKRKTFSLGMANVEMLAVQEQLESKNAEMEALLRELSRSKDGLQAIIDTSPAAIVMVDGRDTISAANRQVLSFFGLAREAVLGKPYPDFINAIKPCFEDFAAFTRFSAEMEGICQQNGSFELHDIYARSVLLRQPHTRSIVAVPALVRNEAGEALGKIWVFNDITQLKRADEVLHTIAEASPIPFIISRLEDGRIIYVNEPLAAMVGMTPQEMIGTFTPDFYADLKDRDALLDRLNREGSLRGHELQIKQQDGTLRWMSFSLVITELAGEKVIVGGIYDIDTRRKAEEALRLYRRIFINSNDSIAVLSVNGEILEVNPAAVRLFGYAEAELKGATSARFIGADTFQEMLHSLPAEGVYSVRREIVATAKDGRKLDVELSLFPILDDDSRVIYRIGFARDITERKQAEAALRKAHDELDLRVQQRTAELARINEELRESERKNVALLDAIPDLMFRLRRDGIYLAYRAPKDSSLALPPEEVVGKTVFQTLPPELAETTMAILKRVIDSEESEIMEYRMPHKQEMHYFEARIVKSGDDEVLAIVRDITERKLAEQALQKAHEQLELRVQERTAELEQTNRDLRTTQAQLVQSEKMAALGMLVAGIAHEINTPVGAINSMHNTLVRAIAKFKQVLDERLSEGVEGDPKVSAILKVIEDANRVVASGSERVTNIVRRLRSFARLDEAELKEANIHEGIEDTLVLIHHEIKHHIELEKDYGELPSISCYPGRLNQVLLNLLINARQAIQGEGKIRIKTWHEAGKIYISISDNGIGIPAEHLQKIFDPGFTTKGVGVGTGLGLSIVFRIVREDHRGEISVESKPGEGTTFTVAIPDNLDQLIEHT